MNRTREKVGKSKKKKTLIVDIKPNRSSNFFAFNTYTTA